MMIYILNKDLMKSTYSKDCLILLVIKPLLGMLIQIYVDKISIELHLHT